MNLFKRKPKKSQSPERCPKKCEEDIQKTHKNFQEFMKSFKEESEREVKNNGDWLKIGKAEGF